MVEPPSPRRRRPGPGRAGAGARPAAAVVPPAPAGRVAVGVAAAILLLAPPDSNAFWAVNGFRSLPPAGAAGLLLAALATALPARRGMRAPAGWAACAVALAAIVAFALRERIHLLGDTQLRLRAMAAFSERIVPATVAEWSERLHAAPLDALVSVLGPIALHRSGVPLVDAVSVVGFALALVAFAGVWRAALRLAPPPGARAPLALALALGGSLEAFAGAAESGAVLLALAWWWWAEALAPLDRPRQALRTALAWVALVLAHRVGLVMLVALLWRATGPPLPGDQPRGRRALLAATVAAAGVALALALGGAGARLLHDARELRATVAGPVRVAWTDPLNALALVAPLALLAPWLAGASALRAFARDPRCGLVLVAALPLLAALAWAFPVGGSGLGAHRDWDANLLLGVTLTVGAGALLTHLPAPRLRGALAWGTPVLALLAGGWVAVQAWEPAALRRAESLLAGPPQLPVYQRSHLHLWFGQRSMDRREFAAAAAHDDRSFELVANPRRALLAAEAWAMAGEPAAARRSLARARARAGADTSLAAGARAIEALIDEVEADSIRRARR